MKTIYKYFTALIMVVFMFVTTNGHFTNDVHADGETYEVTSWQQLKGYVSMYDNVTFDIVDNLIADSTISINGKNITIKSSNNSVISHDEQNGRNLNEMTMFSLSNTNLTLNNITLTGTGTILAEEGAAGGLFIDANDNSIIKIDGAHLKNLDVKRGSSGRKYGPIAPVVLKDSELFIYSGEIDSNTILYSYDIEGKNNVGVIQNYIRNLDGIGNSLIAGGIYSSNSVIHMNNGSFITNNISNCGGIILDNQSTMNLSGGNVEYNTGVYYAGGISVQNGSELNMTSGNISNNNTWSSGGGVEVLSTSRKYNQDHYFDFPNGSGEFTFDGGEISNNMAYIHGGGVYVESNDVHLNKGKIYENEAFMVGGGVYVAGDSTDYAYLLKIDDVRIQNNHALCYGINYSNEEKILDGIRQSVGDSPGISLVSFSWNDPGSGGGLWFCRFGGTLILNSENYTINKNTSFGNEVDDIYKKYNRNSNSDGSLLFLKVNEQDRWVLNGDEYAFNKVGDRPLNENVLLVNNNTSYNQDRYLEIYDNKAGFGGGIGVNGALAIGDYPSEIGLTEAALTINKSFADNISRSAYFNLYCNNGDDKYLIDEVTAGQTIDIPRIYFDPNDGQTCELYSFKYPNGQPINLSDVNSLHQLKIYLENPENKIEIDKVNMELIERSSGYNVTYDNLLLEDVEVEIVQDINGVDGEFIQFAINSKFIQNVTNSKQPTLTIKKVDKEGQPIKDVVLALYNENNEMIRKWTTDEEAVEVFDNLSYPAKYRITEIDKPDEYILANDINVNLLKYFIYNNFKDSYSLIRRVTDQAFGETLEYLAYISSTYENLHKTGYSLTPDLSGLTTNRIPNLDMLNLPSNSETYFSGRINNYSEKKNLIINTVLVGHPNNLLNLKEKYGLSDSEFNRVTQDLIWSIVLDSDPWSNPIISTGNSTDRTVRNSSEYKEYYNELLKAIEMIEANGISLNANQIGTANASNINLIISAIPLLKENPEITVKMVNKKDEHKVIVYKVDSSGNSLGNAKFRLETEDGELIEEFSSTGRDEFILPSGKYVLKETQAPMGYKIEGNGIKTFEIKDNDENEIEIRVVNGDAPIEIATAASFIDEKRENLPSSLATIVDTITYSGLKPGKTYTLVGELHVKSGGLINGAIVRKEFTPKDSQKETMTFEVDTTSLVNEEIVVFEYLYENSNIPIAKHVDINDKAQTVKVIQPQLEKYVKNDVTADLASFNEVFEYEIMGFIPNNAIEAKFTDVFINAIELADSESIKVYNMGEENNHKANGTVMQQGSEITDAIITKHQVNRGFDVKIEGDAITPLRGKWIKVVFNAQIRDASYIDVYNKLLEKQNSTANPPSAKDNQNVWANINDNGNVISEIKNHDGVFNSASLKLTYQSGGNFTTKSNTVTVEPELIQLKASKKWKNVSNEEMGWPDNAQITLALMAGGREIEERNLNIDMQTAKFTPQPIIDGVTYKIVEKSIENVNAALDKNPVVSDNIWTFTNKLIPEPSIEKYINKDVHASLIEYDNVFTYDIMAYVPENAEKVMIWDELVDSLMFEDGIDTQVIVAIKDSNNHQANGSVKETGSAPSTTITPVITGNRLEVNIDDAVPYQGKWIQLTFKAKYTKNVLTTLNIPDSQRITDNKTVVSRNKDHTGTANTASYKVYVGGEWGVEFKSNTVTHDAEKVKLQVTKKWFKANNEEMGWPDNIERIAVDVMANDEKIDTIYLTSSESQKTIELPRLVDVEYSLFEKEVAGFTSTLKEITENIYELSNKKNPEKTQITVSKVWNDDNNNDRIRPENITVTLTGSNGYSKTETFTESYTFTDLDKVDTNGNLITYEINEQSVEGYTPEIKKLSDEQYQIINTHENVKHNIKVRKVWDDDNNVAEYRPQSITVNLYDANKPEEIIREIVLSDENNWEYTLEDVDVFDNGLLTEYMVSEVVQNPYRSSLSYQTNMSVDDIEFVITNTYHPEYVDITVEKSWNDANNINSTRPQSITLRLLADGEEVKSVTLDDTNWTVKGPRVIVGEFVTEGKELICLADSQEEAEGIAEAYSIEFVEFSDGVAVFHTEQDPQTVIDYGIANGLVQLSLNMTTVYDENITYKNSFSYRFEHLLKNKNGKDIVYTVLEDAVDNYNSQSDKPNPEDPNFILVTNTYTPGKTSYSVSKTWEDNNNNDGIRPQSVKIQLYANNVPVGEPVDVIDTYTWHNLDMDILGQKIIYKVMEIDIPKGYTPAYIYQDGVGEIINIHYPYNIHYNIKKIWNDEQNKYNERPESIDVVLSGSDGSKRSIQLIAERDYCATIYELPKFHNKELINYSLSEVKVEGYEGEIKLEGNDFTLTNTRIKKEKPVLFSKTSINGTEELVGATLEIFKGDQMIDQWISTDKKHEFELKVGEYRMVEHIAPENYDIAEDIVFRINDDLTIEVKDGDNWISVSEIQMKDAPLEVEVEISKQDINGTDELPGATLIVEGKNFLNEDIKEQWISTDKIHKIKLMPGDYTLTEITAPKGYDIAESIPFKIDGQGKLLSEFTIEGVIVMKDKPLEKYIDVEISKVVLGQGKELSGAELRIEGKDYKGDEVEITWISTGEAKTFKLLEGKYTLIEDRAPLGYLVAESIEFEVTKEGKILVNGSEVNKLVMEDAWSTIDIDVIKEWEDRDDFEKVRPDEITVRLYANGKEVDSKKVTKENNWTYTFKDLREYDENGEKIVYTIDEDGIRYYNKNIKGYTIKNILDQNELDANRDKEKPKPTPTPTPDPKPSPVPQNKPKEQIKVVNTGAR